MTGRTALTLPADSNRTIRDVGWKLLNFALGTAIRAGARATNGCAIACVEIAGEIGIAFTRVMSSSMATKST